VKASKHNLQAASPKPINIRHKVLADPFKDIPYDVICEILSYLSGKSLQDFINASYIAYELTRDHNGFWKKRVRSDMPWLWELQKLIDESPQAANFDYKRLYLWLDKETTPTYGMRGRFMGLANRRRIWEASEEIAGFYHQRLREIAVTPIIEVLGCSRAQWLEWLSKRSQPVR
jgi:hypothetical protein